MKSITMVCYKIGASGYNVGRYIGNDQLDARQNRMIRTCCKIESRCLGDVLVKEVKEGRK